MPTDREHGITGIATLDQPTRRDLYRFLAERNTWVGRDEAATALDVPRSVAAFHLDKLAEAGIAEVKFERMTGRSGPGAGRPAKLYRRSSEETSASIPERHYDLAGELLARAVGEATRTGAAVSDCLSAAARAAGADLGARAGREEGRADAAVDVVSRVVEVLEEGGYEPTIHAGSEIALRNCPFHRLAEQERSLVCGMNLDFLTGCLEGMGVDEGLDPRLAPEPGYCCVRIATPEQGSRARTER